MKLIRHIIDSIATKPKFHFWIFLLVLLLLTAIMMLAYSPLHPGHDFHFHLRRLQALIQAIDNGTFPYYIDYSAIDGYGYLSKAFYCDIILIPFAIVGLFSNSIVAYQVMIATMTILCGIFTYWTVNTIYSSKYAATIAAILYTFSYYRLLDVYHRSALGEALSFTFVPIVMLGLYYIIKADYRKWYILAIGFSLMVFTHVISTVLMAVTVFIILCVYYKPLIKEPKRLLYLGIAAVSTVFITAYYLFPMIEQMLSDTYYYQARQIMGLAENSKMSFHWMIWGMFSGVIQPVQIFVPGTGLLLTCVIALRVFVTGKSDKLRSADIGVIIGLVFILASTVLFPWGIYPFKLLNFIQLPWRLYEFSSFFFAVSGAYYLSVLVKTNLGAFAAMSMLIVATILVIGSDGRAYNETRRFREIIETPTVENDFHLGGFEYVPHKVPSIKALENRGHIVETNNSDTQVFSANDSAKDVYKLKMNVEISSPDVLVLPLIYYKGYTAINHGQEDKYPLIVSESNRGLAQIEIRNSGLVEVYYEGTIIQKISFYITIVSILSLIGYIVRQNCRKRKTSVK